MKLTELWSQSTSPTISFELFPGRSEKAEVKLRDTIDVLAGLQPDFVSVTFGAGGSTREGSYQLVKYLIEEKSFRLLPYFACYGLGPDEIEAVLNDYQELGVDNILAVRGDEPREEEFEPHPQSLAHASDLVAFIKPRFDYCIGVAGYPEGHIEAESQKIDLEYLKLKVDLGAEFIVTNYFYDNEYFFEFVSLCRQAGIEVPILPGVMPVYSVKMMNMLASLCGATITTDLQQGIDSLPEEDREALLEFGIEYALDQCRGLLEAGVPGLHLYTMDRSSSVVPIVNGLRAEGYL